MIAAVEGLAFRAALQNVYSAAELVKAGGKC